MTETEKEPGNELDADGIADNIFTQMNEDKDLSDEDKAGILTKLFEKAGTTPPQITKPSSGHWSERPLFGGKK